MKIVKELSIRKVGNEYLAIKSTDNGVVDFTGAFGMNETAFFILDNVKDIEFTESYLVELLVDNYEVSQEVARKDVDKIIKSLKDLDIIQD